MLKMLLVSLPTKTIQSMKISKAVTELVLHLVKLIALCQTYWYLRSWMVSKVQTIRDYQRRLLMKSMRI